MIKHAGLGDRNLALVADPYRENYMRGMSPEVSDLPSLLDCHRRLLQELPHVTEVYHLGHSSGGYGALLFGHLLGSKKVWAFAPRTARPETATAAKAFLKQQLSAGVGATEHRIYYSPHSPRDCAFADHIAQCPGVVLAPYAIPPPEAAVGDNAALTDVEGYYHRGVLRTIISSGDLRRFMPDVHKAGSTEGRRDIDI